MPLKTIRYTDILRNENHLYGIVLVHYTVLNRTKHVQLAGYRNFKKLSKLEFLPACLPACLPARLPAFLPVITVIRLEAKQSSAWSPFYATITDSPVGYTFRGSSECRPSVPCLFFYLQSGCWSSSSKETILRH